MKIVIFGLARSGTTALFYLIKNALPAGTLCLFEPRSFHPRSVQPGFLRKLLGRGRERDVLAKVLPFRPTEPGDAASFSTFDRQVLIVRDPRDRIISRLLYVVYHSTFFGNDYALRLFLDRLVQKEEDPRSVPVMELLRLYAELDGASFSFDTWAAEQTHHSVRRPLEFHDARPHLFVLKYEDLVEGWLDALAQYLGLTLSADATVSREHGRVARTKSHGNWRDWLTSEDVELLRPVLQPYLDRYYEDADWDLSVAPSIPPEFGSGYVVRIVNERRSAEGIQPFHGPARPAAPVAPPSVRPAK